MTKKEIKKIKAVLAEAEKEAESPEVKARAEKMVRRINTLSPHELYKRMTI